jgi:hypothetical protein
VVMKSICSENVSLSSSMTPRIFIEVWRWMPGVGGGGLARFRKKIISEVLDGFILRLEVAAHFVWWSISAGMVCVF